jgi:hypothetical protein
VRERRDLLYRQKHEPVHEARPKNGPILEELPWNVWDRSKEFLPDHEASQKYHTENDHQDDVVRRPSVRRVSGQTEWQQEKRPPRDGEQHANDIELHKVVLVRLPLGTSVRSGRIDASLFAFSDAPEEDQPRRDAECDKDDGKRTECPTPCRVIVEVLSDLRACKDSCNGRCSEDTVHDDAVTERC